MPKFNPGDVNITIDEYTGLLNFYTLLREKKNSVSTIQIPKLNDVAQASLNDIEGWINSNFEATFSLGMLLSKSEVNKDKIKFEAQKITKLPKNTPFFENMKISPKQLMEKHFRKLNKAAIDYDSENPPTERKNSAEAKIKKLKDMIKAWQSTYQDAVPAMQALFSACEIDFSNENKNIRR